MELGTAGRLLILAFASLALLGCGERTTTNSKTPAKKVEPKSAEAPAADKAPPVTYTSVPAALDAVEQISSSGNPSSQELMQIEQWLGSQGRSAVPQLTAALADSNRHLAVRITACRALSRVGAPGKEPLLQATTAEPRQLRLKATECLGRIQPTDKAIVDKLVAITDSDDFDQRKAALTALANIGPAASKADPKLVDKLTTLLNDTRQDETLRGLARTTLKKVDPRTGLQKAH